MMLADFLWKTLAMEDPYLLPAGHYASICGTIMGGLHPDTGK
jgi:N-methylhydantoinase B